nr:MAG TPA: hypothetical protein [Caudoviricetes sp.]
MCTKSGARPPVCRKNFDNSAISHLYYWDSRYKNRWTSWWSTSPCMP